jgi:hypothetical protein
LARGRPDGHHLAADRVAQRLGVMGQPLRPDHHLGHAAGDPAEAVQRRVDLAADALAGHHVADRVARRVVQPAQPDLEDQPVAHRLRPVGLVLPGFRLDT